MEIVLEDVGETGSANNRFSFSGYQKARIMMDIRRKTIKKEKSDNQKVSPYLYAAEKEYQK